MKRLTLKVVKDDWKWVLRSHQVKVRHPLGGLFRGGLPDVRWSVAGERISPQYVPDAVDDQGARLCRELTRADSGVLVGQVLADQGKRNLDRGKVAEEEVLRGMHLGIRPVVPQPVAVAVPAGQTLLVRIAGVVALPMAGVGQHPCLQYLWEVGLIGRADE